MPDVAAFEERISQTTTWDYLLPDGSAMAELDKARAAAWQKWQQVNPSAVASGVHPPDHWCRLVIDGEHVALRVEQTVRELPF